MNVRVGSLFSGIGGLDLGLERAGMRVVWQSEIDPFCCDVLTRHWPDVPNLGDCRETDWSEVERPDLVCGGFPCQPVSKAGRRRGTQDERWLWPEVDRAVRALRPRYVLLENVPGLLAHGMGDVLGDLAACGYDAEWDCIPAAAVGAPHLRDRVWVVAYRQEDTPRSYPHIFRPHRTPTHEDGQGVGFQPGDEQEREPRSVGAAQAGTELDGDVADPGGGRGPRDGLRAGGDEPRVGGAEMADPNGPSRGAAGGPGQEVHGPSPLERPGRCGSGFGDHWAAEPDVGRVAYGVPDRVDRLRALGNAVVPQVAEWIGQRLMQGWSTAA